MLSRIQLACYGLIASACVLAGLIVAQTSGTFATEARADLVMQQGDFTVMTAQTANNEESLFVLNGRSGRMLVYRQVMAGNGGTLEQVGAADMNGVFRQAFPNSR